MNVAGFEEPLTSSVLIEIEADLSDLYRLLTTYADAGNTDRLYETELDLLEAAEFDMQLAGAELLGRDVAEYAMPGFYIKSNPFWRWRVIVSAWLSTWFELPHTQRRDPSWKEL